MNASVLRLLSFTYIVVSVMALNCLPVDERKVQNPLTKIWLPYALQDSTLFLATLTFAEVHLEILSGNYKSHRALLHKGASIKAVNAKLGDREQALSNETIGAVAMLAAMEVCHERRLLVKNSNQLTYSFVGHSRQLQRSPYPYEWSTKTGLHARRTTELRMGWHPLHVHFMVP